MIRAAVVAPYFPPSTGGVQSYAAQLSGLLARPDDPVLVITTGTSRWRYRTEHTPHQTIVWLPVLVRWSNTPVHPAWPLLVWWLLRRHRIELVITHAPVVGLADVTRLVLGRRRLIATYHAGSMVKGESHRQDRVLRAYERQLLPWVFRRAETVVTVSPVALGADSRHTEIIPPGFDPEVFCRRPAASMSDPDEPPIVGYVGRMDSTSRWKGVDRLIDAVALLRRDGLDLRLQLVGPGDLVPELAARAERVGLGDRVEFLGPRHGAALAECYRRACVTVLPSVTAAESFGMTLVEAMACGSAVIGTLTTGAASVINDGRTGRLVPPDDVAALAAAIRELLVDPVRRADLVEQAALEVAARYSWSAFRSRWRALLERGGR